MSREDRATAFVRRTDTALRDLERAQELWAESIRSSTEEMRLHGLSLDLDNTIRRVAGQFEAWSELQPSQVQMVRTAGPVQLMWVISAHPSGHVREAFVHQTKYLENDRILPHLANRSIDFVPQIRDLASPLVIARLDQVLAQYSGPDRPTALPTPVHIAVTKLLAPRSAVVSPVLLHRCIDLAKTAHMPLPRSFRGGGMAKMLHRCDQTLAAAAEPEVSAAVEALIAYFNQAPPT